MRQVILRTDGSLGGASATFTPNKPGTCTLTCFGSAYSNTQNQMLSVEVKFSQQGNGGINPGAMKMFSNSPSQHRALVPFSMELELGNTTSPCTLELNPGPNTVIDENDHFLAVLDF